MAGTLVAVTAVPVVLDEPTRAQLRRIVRAGASQVRAVLRAQIVLAAADGACNTHIAVDLRIRQDTVRKWRGRFAVAGLAGLADAKRSGRPRRYGAEQRVQVVAVATCAAPYPEATWSHRRIAARLADLAISASQVGRILADCDLRPHRGSGAGSWPLTELKETADRPRRGAARPAGPAGRRGRAKAAKVQLAADVDSKDAVREPAGGARGGDREDPPAGKPRRQVDGHYRPVPARRNRAEPGLRREHPRRPILRLTHPRPGVLLYGSHRGALSSSAARSRRQSEHVGDRLPNRVARTLGEHVSSVVSGPPQSGHRVDHPCRSIEPEVLCSVR